MGLDQHAFTTEHTPSNDVDFNPDEEFGQEGYSMIAQWRRFFSLEFFMSELYASKGGGENEFNCNHVALSSEDLDELTQAMDEERGDIDDEDYENTMSFIERAHDEIAHGNTVFYSSWW